MTGENIDDLDDMEHVDLWMTVKDCIMNLSHLTGSAPGTVYSTLSELVAQYTHPTPPEVKNIVCLWKMLPNTHTSVGGKINAATIMMEREDWVGAKFYMKEAVTSVQK